MAERGFLQINGVGYKCTCPDYAKSAEPVPSRTAISSSRERDWTTSEAGTPEGVPCKHIYSVLRYLGRLTDDVIPDDALLDRVEFPRILSQRAGFIGNQDEAFGFGPSRGRRPRPEDYTNKRRRR